MYYYVYILLCRDKSYYTGVTNDLERRIFEHSNPTEKSYTAIRLPVRLVWYTVFDSIEEAIQSEKQIKGWGRKKKDALVNNNFTLISELSKRRT